MINRISSVAERAIWTVDAFINRAVLFAWTSTLRHHADDTGGGSTLAARFHAAEHISDSNMRLSS
jgi:hypothetical protein